MNYVTIPNFEDLSIQDCFNMAANHIAKTKMLSYDSIKESCSYAGYGCNAAPLLTSPSKVKNAPWYELVAEGYVPEHNSDFISELQTAHDDVALNGYANSHSLNNEYVRHSYISNMEILASQYGIDDSALDPLRSMTSKD